MQIRYATDLSIDEYIEQKAWKDANLEKCPLHPEGGCGFSRHGTYKRNHPKDLRLARWYCSMGHQTFSLLPDFLSSRLPGLLIEVEEVVVEVENSKSQSEVVDRIREDVEYEGVLRWLRRRISLVKIGLEMLINNFPSLFSGCTPSISSFRSVLNVEYALPKLREIAEEHLIQLPPPLGFCPEYKKNSFQHKTGTDPPSKI